MRSRSQPVDAAEVLWTYLANEHKYKNVLNDVAHFLYVEELKYSPDFKLTAPTIIEKIEYQVGKGLCEHSVLITLKMMQPWAWELRCISGEQARFIWSMLSADPELPVSYERFQRGQQGLIGDLLTGYRDYLKLVAAEREKKDHQDLILALRNGKSFTHHPIIDIVRNKKAPTVVDGRHRLFALAELPDLTVQVYCGKAA